LGELLKFVIGFARKTECGAWMLDQQKAKKKESSFVRLKCACALVEILSCMDV